MPLRIVSILLISVMMYKPIVCMWTVVDFAMNKDYIAAYLCENQDRPELDCQGKCFLMQKLKKQSHNNADHQTKQLTQLSKLEVMNVHELTKFVFSKSGFSLIENYQDNSINSGYLAGIFHPPIAIA
ncbi:MAG: hypothetical protein ABJF11_16980 [Reichenbachiella sp.]|uniref:hypothetical protein n=1 Tax=Reichenbachiella sp. TaxID=2184521 RepID=UPI003267D886